MDDVEGILLVEEEAWPEGLRATEEMFRSRIATFPQGTLVAENGERIVGVVVGEIVTYNENAETIPSWREITDGGFIRRTHDPSGDTLYGVNLSVSPLAGGGASRLLLLAMRKRVIGWGLRQIALGSRIPRYHKFADRMSPEEYLAARLDPEVRFYQRFGVEVVRVLPDYIEDPDSCNNGVLLVWRNPFYGWPFRGLWRRLFRI